MGDILEYIYPTSWSSNYDNTFNFVGDEINPVIIVLTPHNQINSIINTYNTYDENEIMLAPITFVVTNKEKINNITLLEVEPYWSYSNISKWNIYQLSLMSMFYYKNDFE